MKKIYQYHQERDLKSLVFTIKLYENENAHKAVGTCGKQIKFNK